MEVEALASKPTLPPDWAALMEDFWALRSVTAPGFADTGRISMADMAALHGARFWDAIGYPFADYFDTIAMLDKTLRKFHADKNPPKN